MLLITLDKNHLYLIKNSKNMNILFLHGLESPLTTDKKYILQKYGNVFAPALDYKSNPDMIQTLFYEYYKKNIDVIIGSSMGGFTGFYLSKLLKVPALLFNPALPYHATEQNIPNIDVVHQHLIQFVLGIQDDTIKAEDNLKYILNFVPRENDIRIHLLKDLAHRIPVTVFEAEVHLFFK